LTLWHIFSSPLFWWDHPSLFQPIATPTNGIYHRTSKYNSILLARLKDWVKDEFKAKPIEVLLRDFSATAGKVHRPTLLGEDEDYDVQKKKCWIRLPILPWLLRRSLSLAGAANPPRGREKWRCKVSAKKRMSSQFSAIGSSHKSLRSSLQHPHSYSYLFNFVG